MLLGADNRRLSNRGRFVLGRWFLLFRGFSLFTGLGGEKTGTSFVVQGGDVVDVSLDEIVSLVR